MVWQGGEDPRSTNVWRNSAAQKRHDGTLAEAAARLLWCSDWDTDAFMWEG
jgi:hypothetical protein